MRTTFLLLASLAGLPLLSAAQTAPVSTSSKFYVGVGASVITDAVLQDHPFSSPTATVSPALTLGWQFTSHVSAQLGAAYRWQTQDDNASTYTARTRTRSLTLPVLLRYAFLPASSPFHLDALGGLTIRHYTTSYNEAFSSSSGTPRTDSGDYGFTNANLTLGPALRYSLTRQIELSAMPLVNIAIGQNYPAFRNRLFWNAQASLNYLFGQ